MSKTSRWFMSNTPELKEQLQRWANTQRLEGNYVAAQTTERTLAELKRSQASARLTFSAV